MLLLPVGCGSFHEVAVVSHSEEVSPLEALEVEPVAALESLNLEDISRSSPADQSGISEQDTKEIFTQSAEDTILPWTLQDVFFDYDQIRIRRDSMLILEQNAKVLLKRYPNRQVLIQGHCDERGTEEYNLILGERRALAVKNYLVNLGVSASQLRVLSLGKSQPFCSQRSLTCFQHNRRAHFVLK